MNCRMCDSCDHYGTFVAVVPCDPPKKQIKMKPKWKCHFKSEQDTNTLKCVEIDGTIIALRVKINGCDQFFRKSEIVPSLKKT